MPIRTNKTVNRQTVQTILDQYAFSLKNRGLTSKVQIGEPWCEGAQPSVTVRIGASWFGTVKVTLENDCECWTLAVDLSGIDGHMSDMGFDDLTECIKMINDIVQHLAKP